MTESLLATFQQWLLFLGAVLVVGCVAWRLVVTRRVPASAALTEVARRVAGFGALATLVVLVAWALRMVVQVRGFRDEFVPLWDDVSFLLFETTWGTVWIAQGAVLPFLVGAFAWARGGSPTAWRAAAVFALGLVATLAMTSHAMGVETARSLFVTADAVHALAAGCWVGSLAVIVTLGRTDRALFTAQLRAFSPLAHVSVAALVAMGLLVGWEHIGALSNLWLTGYGRVLSAKVALAGAVMLAGLVNWRRGLAVMDTEEGAVAIGRRSVVEISLATGVLLLTAVLVHSVKPE